jgi:hypothetical protein
VTIDGRRRVLEQDAVRFRVRFADNNIGRKACTTR